MGNIYLTSKEAQAVVRRSSAKVSLSTLRRQSFAYKNDQEGKWYFEEDSLRDYLRRLGERSVWVNIPFPQTGNRYRFWRFIALNGLRVTHFEGRDKIHEEDLKILKEFMDRRSTGPVDEKGD